ncbi:MAG: NAD(P)/FAD-dependent oxidoreductase [Ruminococcaceae bacterium]|nr:NAD(P)/FAD-dependent oxidoreductase [Oscillospiraceae bacterium]
MTKTKDKAKVVIIGGGAAGMMAAIFAADAGADVVLIERMRYCGVKLAITGKGRCNVTNDSTLEEFLSNVPTNPRFLYSALNALSTQDTMAFFENEGVPLKVERGKRVFPVSDKAKDIVRALTDSCAKRGVETVFGRVEKIVSENGRVVSVIIDGKIIKADSVIVATGGKSYPRTGSDGDGYRFATELGHTVIQPRPSLVPITSKSSICPELQGLSLKNVALKITKTGSDKEVYEDFGEMMFTHFGLTGPMILSASAHIPDIAPSKYEAHIDLKPALDEKMLDTRILSDFSKYHNKDFMNSLDDLLPRKLIPVIIRLSGIPQRKKVNSITREERAALVNAIKDFRVSLSGFRPIDEAIVTKGGVSVKEINPKTMESKLCGGLYFAGEVIDVDAYTGGFNLQIAFSTGALAGTSAANVVC